MKIGFYNPYLDSLGGGERYILALAGHWSKSHAVSIFWNEPAILAQAEKRLHIDLSRVKVVPDSITNEPFISKLFSTSQYDLIFYVSDGSVPFSCATKNIILFQAPFIHISYPFFKKAKYQAIIVYSEFVKSNIDEAIKKDATIIHPPVDVDSFVTVKKEHVILSVGRFSSLYQAKKQDVLIEMFQKGLEQGLLKGWNLILAGGLLESDNSYFSGLKNKASGLPIIFMPNCTFDELKSVYGKASIYWHAAGYQETDPIKMEHFGITTVEAMAAGCVPIVYDAGGQSEIVRHGIDGYLWTTQEECLVYTGEIIKKIKVQLTLRRNALQRSKLYSIENFYAHFDTLLEKIRRT